MTEADILRANKLRNTASRLAILAVFTQKNIAFSEPEIEHQLDIDCDRVTIYRTLTTFLNKGIIHKVLDDTGVMKYALCSSACNEGDHNHVHFKCSVCRQTICLEDIAAPHIHLPPGFKIEEMNVLIQGICKNCDTDTD